MNIEQEKLLSEKNKEMEEVRRELEQAKTSQRDKEDEVTLYGSYIILVSLRNNIYWNA